jgi:hypothetical protein
VNHNPDGYLYSIMNGSSISHDWAKLKEKKKKEKRKK